ncbi:unnamed protein product [Brassica oleracea]|uniref:(rape) hypothetical protein n=1 Tax=Brassica napus TaxID=3708 RepID=A0A816R8G8_BRANA|nr:unnamed protein product [Brassica napus]
MISSHIFLYNLKPSCCSQTVVARLLCFGEARNVKKGGDLMGVDIVLLDDPHCCKGAPASHFQTPSERGRHLGDQWLSCCKNYHPLQAVRFNRSPNIETTNGWVYISCSKCSRKLQRGLS